MNPVPDPAVAAATARRHERILTATGLAAERILYSELEPAAFNDSLALLGSATGVSRVYVFAIHTDDTGRLLADQTYEWCAPGVEPQINNPELRDIDLVHAGFGRWISELQANRAIFGPVAQLPPDERPVLEAQQIRSIAVTPILTHGALSGFIGFDDCQNEHSWTAETVACLNVAARVLAAAFERLDFKRRSEAALAEYQALVDHLQEAVFRLDGAGRMTFLSPAWTRLLGWRTEEALGRPLAAFVHDEDRPALEEALRSLAEGRTDHCRRELRMRSTRQSDAWLLLSATAILSPPPVGTLITGSLTDIEAVKRTEAELVRAHQAAEAANRGKSEFLSTISHELRTPLNGILGLTESLIETKGAFEPERTRRYLGIIHESGRQLLAQINDILDVARLEAGRVEARLEPVNLTDACQSAAQAVAPEARRKSISLETPGDGTPLLHVADARLLRHALQNLVANAVKFTPAGGRVEIRAALTAQGSATIEVTDTGIGIPTSELHKLFKPFSQVDSSLSRRFGGTGLGLFLVERMVRLQGGQVRVDSTPGVGSRFSIDLPAAPPGAGTAEATAEARPHPAQPAPRPTLLVIGHDPHLHLIVAEFLAPHGFVVRHLRPDDVESAARRPLPGPVVALVDGTQGGDAPSVLTRWRAQERFAAAPCLVLLGSDQLPEAHACRAGGIHALLNAPLSLAELGAALARVTGLRL